MKFALDELLFRIDREFREVVPLFISNFIRDILFIWSFWSDVSSDLIDNSGYNV